MTIRRAQPKDIGRILELLVQVCNVHADGRPDLFLRDTTKYTAAQLEAIIADDATPVFVAVDDADRVLGYSFGVFQPHAQDNNWPDITTYYIDDICVDEACRGQHVGTALYEYTRDFAKAAGCYNLTLNVWAKNEAAQRFYEACGMKPQKTCLETLL